MHFKDEIVQLFFLQKEILKMKVLKEIPVVKWLQKGKDNKNIKWFQLLMLRITAIKLLKNYPFLAYKYI